MIPYYSDFTVLTVSIGYNHFLKKWAECVSKLNTKPKSIIIGIENIDVSLKEIIDDCLPNVKWVKLVKVGGKLHGYYYNQLISLVDTTWVCKIDADDQILPSAYDKLNFVDSDIFGFGNVSSSSKNVSLSDAELDSEKILFNKNNLLNALSPFKKIVWDKDQFKNFIYDDWAFWIDAAKNGFKFSSSNTVNYIYLQHDSQETKTTDEKYERSILLKYKENAKKTYLKQSEISAFDKYLFALPDHYNAKQYSDTLEIMMRLISAGKTEIYLLDFSSSCGNPIIDSNSSNLSCKSCESLISNLQENFNFNLIIIQTSFHTLLDTNFSFHNKFDFLNQILNRHQIDCLINSRFINLDVKQQYLDFCNGVNISSINILSNVNEDNPDNVLEMEIISKFGISHKSLKKFYSFNKSDLIILNEIEILTNLPIDHLLDFNRISEGFSQALSQLNQMNYVQKLNYKYNLIKSFVKGLTK
jgi:hypothetical protein